ncbi:MAG TPA: DinB family protein [Casimicrobiaceae bacterium]
MNLSPLAHHFYTMACNNAWSNHRLLTACSKLSQADFVARRVSFFPSLKATLNHILTVDWYYVDALERGLKGEPPNRDVDRFFDPEEPFDTCTALSTEQHAVDRRLIDVCATLDDTRLALPIPMMRRAGVQTENATRLLAHLFQHQIHHRGQAHAMLAGTTVKPPQLDEFFCANEAHLRAAELAEIGLSEQAIWGSGISDQESGIRKP